MIHQCYYFLTSCSSDGSSNTSIGDSPGFYLPTVDPVDPLDVDGDGIPNTIDTDDDNDNIRLMM